MTCMQVWRKSTRMVSILENFPQIPSLKELVNWRKGFGLRFKYIRGCCKEESTKLVLFVYGEQEKNNNVFTF